MLVPIALSISYIIIVMYVLLQQRKKPLKNFLHPVVKRKVNMAIKFKILDNSLRKKIIHNAKRIIRRGGDCGGILCGGCPVYYISKKRHIRPDCSFLGAKRSAQLILDSCKKKK